MAWSVADLSAANVTAAAADYPLVMGQHALATAYRAGQLTSWWNRNGDFTDVNGNEETANFIAARAADRQLTSQTYPNANRTTWYLMFNLGTSLATIDYVMVAGHNLSGVAGGSVAAQIADNNTFATNLQTIATWAPVSTSKRLVSLSLGHGGDPAPNVYSGVQFFRLKIDATGAMKPIVTEVVIGQRRQLLTGPFRGYDPDRRETGVADFESRNGMITRYLFHRGRAVLRPRIIAVGSTHWTPITDWWTDTLEGSRPFGYVEKPNSAPTVARWMMASPELGLPYETDKIRVFDFEMREAGPFYDRE